MLPTVIPTVWLKHGVSFLISGGTGLIVRNIIRATTPPYTGAIDRFLITVAEISISGLVAAKTYQYVEQQLDIYLPPQKSTDEPQKE